AGINNDRRSGTRAGDIRSLNAIRKGGVNRHVLPRFEHQACRWADTLIDVAAGNTRSHVIGRRTVRIAVRPRPILTRSQPYDPPRSDRHGVAETESLLPDDAGYIDPS